MTTVSVPLTSDLTRVLAAIRRRWLGVAIAVLVGGLLGLGYSALARPATYTSVVWTPPIAVGDFVGVDVKGQPNLMQLVEDVQSPAFMQSAGLSLDGIRLLMTPAADFTSVKISASASTDAAAIAGVRSFAEATAHQYFDRRNAMVSAALKAVESGAAVVDSKDRAELLVKKGALEGVLAEPFQSPSSPQPAATSAGTLTTTLTLALLLGCAAAGFVALRAFNDRTLRFADEVEEVVGTEAFLVSAEHSADVPVVRALLNDLVSRGAVVVPVGPGDAPRLVEALKGEGTSGTVVLLTRLGTDTKQELDLAFRAVTASGRAQVLVFAPEAWATFSG